MILIISGTLLLFLLCFYRLISEVEHAKENWKQSVF